MTAVYQEEKVSERTYHVLLFVEENPVSLRAEGHREQRHAVVVKEDLRSLAVVAWVIISWASAWEQRYYSSLNVGSDTRKIFL